MMKIAKEKLNEFFGHDAFLQGQEPLIEQILSGGDAFGIMPTGGGKSLCYQLPSLMMEGTTIVISPLISLMKDQIHSLTQNGIPAAYINSTLSESQVSKVLDNARQGKYKILYLAPERLESSNFLHLSKTILIPFVAIDEAHCASQWGQDFRPSYGLIKNFVSTFAKRPVVAAFTATATKRVQDDVIDLLGLHNPKVVLNSFDRKNLYFEVRKPQKKYLELISILKNKSGEFGIVYCSTRKTVEQLCSKLRYDGFNAAQYHGGLSDKERHETQNDFIYDRINIIVATNAFGMGIDKSNVSFVVHYNMPQDIESYYQEAGRAGRDGSNAECVLMFSAKDIQTNLFLIENTEDRIYESKVLMQELQAKARERLRLMERYCNSTSCLRQHILEYFGEVASPCQNCGNCNSEMEDYDITILSQKILSCVAKSGERFGTKVIIDSLRGSKSEKVARFRLDKISTYGICNESADELREVCKFLIERDYLYYTNEQYPLIKLGKNAAEILKKRATIIMQRKKKERPVEDSFVEPHSYKTDKKTPSSYDADLFSRLKAVRAELAAAQNVPAYIVFHDSTLKEMAASKPTSLQAFSLLSGVGSRKLAAYGNRFLEIISKYLEEKKGATIQSERDLLDFSDIQEE